MMPWMMPYLRFDDDSFKSSFQESLSLMRKNRLFCDVILQVENTEIHAHRNVLASVSPHLMELFTADQDTCNDGNIPSYRLNGFITREGLQFLVDYAYTARLEVPDNMVKQVYLAAWQLRMERVVNECASHLINDLSKDTCLDTRSLPGINHNKSFVAKVDQYIAENFQEIMEKPGFLLLPSVQIEMLQQTQQEMDVSDVVMEDSLSRLVLDWLRREITENHGSIASLQERSHMLFLGLDNSLQDAANLAGERADSDIVKDYKKIASKNTGGTQSKPRRKLTQPERPRVLIYSRDIADRRNDEENLQRADWNLISCFRVFDHTFIALASLNGTLCRLSIQMKLNQPGPASESSSGMNSPSPLESSLKQSTESLSFDEIAQQPPELFTEVAVMKESKCGLGVAELDGKLIVVGGYGRTECLRSVESYSPHANVWTEELSLSEARGRVQIAVIDGTIFAVGGCNGTTELDTVECLKLANRDESPKPKKWKKCSKLPFSRSNSGVCALNGKLYCIGGWNGQNGIKQCDVYCPETDTWTAIAPLNTGRCQSGVVAHNGKIWVVGGSDAWNCLQSVEIYDPETNTWSLGPQLLIQRRGCGLAALNGILYCVGGSNGNESLRTTEYFDETQQTWVLGPTLTTERSIVSVVVVQNRLYAIGGFSGKKFLNTMEYYDEESKEWTKFAKSQKIITIDLDDGNSSDENDAEVEMIEKIRSKLSKKLEKDKISEDETNTIILSRPTVC